MAIRYGILLIVMLTAFGALAGCGFKLPRKDMTDVGIRSRIWSELNGYPEVSTRMTQINVNAGNVSLSGLIESDAMKRRMTEIIRGVAGVRAVDNHLIVQP